ncbi:hypothetical protein ACWCYZ_29520 [Streptomyces virginiae]
MSTSRRRLGTGPDPEQPFRTRDTGPPRARLAAERLPAPGPAVDPPARVTGRRTLGTGPTAGR